MKNMLPSDISSSSRRLIPISCEGALRPSVGVGNSGKEGGDWGDVSRPDRSSSAVPPPSRYEPRSRLLSLHNSKSTNSVPPAYLLVSAHLTCCFRLQSPPSPAACTGWWHASGCRWPAGSQLWTDVRKVTACGKSSWSERNAIRETATTRKPAVKC